MDTEKKNLALSQILLAIGVILIAVCTLIRLLFGSHSYELNLPDYNNLKGVTLTHKGGEEVELPDAYAEDVLFVLKGDGRETDVESIQDAPVNVDDWIKVDFSFSKGGTSTLFVYAKSNSLSGEYFIEQPYNGIYEISRHEYDCIEQYVQ